MNLFSSSEKSNSKGLGMFLSFSGDDKVPTTVPKKDDYDDDSDDEEKDTDESEEEEGYPYEKDKKLKGKDGGGPTSVEPPVDVDGLSEEEKRNILKKLLPSKEDFTWMITRLKTEMDVQKKRYEEMLYDRDREINKLTRHIEVLKSDKDIFKDFFREHTFKRSEKRYDELSAYEESPALVLKQFLSACYNLDKYIQSITLKPNNMESKQFLDTSDTSDLSEISPTGMEFKNIMRKQFIPSIEAIFRNGLRKGSSIAEFVKEAAESHKSVLVKMEKSFEKVGRGLEEGVIFRSFVCQLINDKSFSDFFRECIEGEKVLESFYEKGATLLSRNDTNGIYRRLKKYSKYALRLRNDGMDEKK